MSENWCVFIACTVGFVIHIWGKMEACVKDKQYEPRTRKSYLKQRGRAIFTRLLIVYAVGVVTWKMSDTFLPGVKMTETAILCALAYLYGYASDSKVDKVLAVLGIKLEAEAF